MESRLETLIEKYRRYGIDQQLDYDKYYLYSLITHSTAIEGSTITELENQIMFDNGISLKGKSIVEQNMNLDLKTAYEQMIDYSRSHVDISVERLKHLSALTMKNTGTTYHTMLGDFSSANGDLRLLNVSAGVGGKSYMSFNKVAAKLEELCRSINQQRKVAAKLSLHEVYNMSFDAHFQLVTIHPWADGNGRMARLLMNWLQFEFGLIPSAIFTNEKEDYIKALVETRETEDLEVFRSFMADSLCHHLESDIADFEQSMAEDITEANVSLGKTSDRIVSLLLDNPRHSARTLAETLGLSIQAIEKQLSKLRTAGRIRRIGPAKGGRWEVN